MSEQREFKIPLDWIGPTFDIATKILWFFIAFGLANALGNAIWWGLGLPSVAIPFHPEWSTPAGMILGYAYIHWRFFGGKVKVRDNSLVITWSRGSEEK